MCNINKSQVREMKDIEDDDRLDRNELLHFREAIF